LKTAFPPITAKTSRVLILGTMPGERSLKLQQYYGHSGNHFWKILFALFDRPFTTDYQQRIQLLLDHDIALWDVLSHCEGAGSADTQIKNEVANDFAAFYAQYPRIKHVFFDSAHAEKFYDRHVGRSSDKTYVRIPSPSGAYASKSLAQKIEEWKQVVVALEDKSL
jgi:hypoxanthine-DNA glycosylase